MESKSESSFRVIVIGAGIAGLIASHILQSAGIPHVVLERRTEIAPPEGASIAIYPHGARILYQLGLYDKVNAACVPCQWWFSRTPEGKAMSKNGFFNYVRENHGHDIFLLERRELLQILYDNLPDKSFVRLGCQVNDIKDNVNDIEVILSDDTVEKGDIVIGADGAYSRTRTMMWQNANSNVGKPQPITTKEKTSIKTPWKCLIGMAPGCPEMGASDMTVVHNTHYSFLVLSQPTKTFFFVFCRLDKTFTWPKRANYTEKDAEELAASLADRPLSEGLLFGELWKRRYRGQLISLEEGVLEHWYDGRIALVGDAVHKVTPNIALGGNTAMESTVVLCNHLRRMLDQHSGAKPSRAAIGKMFEAYQNERKPRAKEIMEFSSLITKVQAWDSPVMKFAANWVLPNIPDRKVATMIGEIIKKAPKLDWVDTSGFRNGRVEWHDDEKTVAKPGFAPMMKVAAKKNEMSAEAAFRGLVKAFGAMMFVAVLYSALV